MSSLPLGQESSRGPSRRIGTLCPMADPRLVVVVLLALAGLGCAGGRSSSEPRGFLPRSVTVDGLELRYVLYVPESLDLSKPVPLVLFLHGKGECGTDNAGQLKVGLPRAVRAQPERWPCLILIPQKPDPEKQ